MDREIKFRAQSAYSKEWVYGYFCKNGKEIYEGDIVSCSNWHPSNYQMVFIEGAFCLGGKDGEWITDVTYMEDSKGKHFKVIGNIHQNPELL